VSRSDYSKTATYLRSLFGDGEGLLILWRLRDKKAEWVRYPREREHAAKLIADWTRAKHDTYVCMSLQHDPSQLDLPRTRGTAAGARAIGCIWADIDVRDANAHKSASLPASVEEALAALGEFPAVPTAIVNSGHGLYALWCLREPWMFDAPGERERAERLLRDFQAALRTLWARRGWQLDATHDLARLLRPVGAMNFKVPDNPKPVVLLPHRGPRYNVSELEELADSLEKTYASATASGTGPVATGAPGGIIPEGARNSTLTSLAGTLRRRGVEGAALEQALLAINREQCRPPLPEDEVRAIAKSVSRYPLPVPAGTEEDDATEITTVPWPDPPAPEAFHGLAGDIVRAIEPHTEADPVALLVQFLVAFGNAVGRGPHFVAEADRHGLNLFACLVGATAKGRKGSSWGHIRRLLEAVDPTWTKDHVASGLSSGEGLIWAVRDPIERREPVKERGRTTGYETVLVDAGVEDKRLLVIEGEFASVLRILQREGNTLSPIIRNSWDSGNLRSLTKNSPAVASGAHISIIGHVTKGELLRYLENTEAGNGFANRFLWVCVRRSKCLPEGGNIDEVNFAPLVARLAEALGFAGGAGELKRDEEAREVWHAVYPELSAGKPGLLGAVLARGEAQVMRLACIYALLDLSPVVRPEHLLAALALWEYVEASARFIFGDALGDPVADTILDALKKSANGLTRTEISALFDRNQSSKSITRALTDLLAAGLVERKTVPPEGDRKKPIEVWRAVRQ